MKAYPQTSDCVSGFTSHPCHTGPQPISMITAGTSQDGCETQLRPYVGYKVEWCLAYIEPFLSSSSSWLPLSDGFAGKMWVVAILIFEFLQYNSDSLTGLRGKSIDSQLDSVSRKEVKSFGIIESGSFSSHTWVQTPALSVTF